MMSLTSGEIYDFLYREKPYREEANAIRRIIKNHHPSAHFILDLGCGTAQHHVYLKKEFELDGLDIDTTAIDLAKQKNPQGQYLVQAMEDFQLNKKYDVIISLFSAFGYLVTEEKIIATIQNMVAHLKPNGIIIFEPWLERKDWEDGIPHMQTYENGQYKICRTNVSKSAGNKSILEFHYLISEKDGTTSYFTENHELLFHDLPQLHKLFSNNNIRLFSLKSDLFRKGLLLGKWDNRED